MIIQYANQLVQKLGMGDPITCVYQLIYDEIYNDGMNIIQYFIVIGLRLCIKVDSYVAHMFYAWSLSQITAVPIATKTHIYISP